MELKLPENSLPLTVNEWWHWFEGCFRCAVGWFPSDSSRSDSIDWDLPEDERVAAELARERRLSKERYETVRGLPLFELVTFGRERTPEMPLPEFGIVDYLYGKGVGNVSSEVGEERTCELERVAASALLWTRLSGDIKPASRLPYRGETLEDSFARAAEIGSAAGIESAVAALYAGVPMEDIIGKSRWKPSLDQVLWSGSSWVVSTRRR